MAYSWKITQVQEIKCKNFKNVQVEYSHRRREEFPISTNIKLDTGKIGLVGLPATAQVPCRSVAMRVES